MAVIPIRGTNNSDRIDRSWGVTDGADIILGLGGDDTIFGFGGADTILGGLGADTIDGGVGVDTALYEDSSSGVIVNLANGTGVGGTAEGDVLISIENVTGSSFNDTLIGNRGANVLNGGAADDRLVGGEGADTLIGGTGRDAADYADSSAGVKINLDAGTATGGAAEGDQLTGIEVLIGSRFDDVLTGDEFDNGLQGNAGDDNLAGMGGGDRLFGGDGKDVLKGGGGSDRLEGQIGDDLLIGGADRDVLLGGEDADTFAWWSVSDTGTGASTADLVADFNFADGDRLDFSNIDADVTQREHQDFTFIGTANFTAPGQIRYFTEGTRTYIVLNTDSDGLREAIIEVTGLDTVTADWFLL
jgi:Ca2+-binding RTX toxin-like protein